ncbi:MAG: aminopeptidase P family protein [Deltaproteobacteria bacterium]|nr:aminopeptidase P family protein [Deltaproteobacteria bacterium]
MDDFKVPSGEIESRIKRLQIKMQDAGMDAMLIVQRVDLFYFTGTAQNGYLYVPAQGDPRLFIRKYMPRAQKESSIREILKIRSMREIPGRIMDYYGRLPGSLGLEFDVLPVSDFNFYQTVFKVERYLDGSPLIHETRMIKSPWEIEQMERTAMISGKTFEYMKTAISPGLTEMEFAGMFETYARRLGHGGYLRARNFQAKAYNWHILSGKNGSMVGFIDAPASGVGTSAAFPCGGGNKPLNVDEPIMIDLGTVLNGYHMDETRMYAMGRMPDRAMKACRASIEIHDTVLENVKPGVSVSELFNISVSKAKSLGYKEQYLGPEGYKVSFIGHGIGLELVEHPIIARDRDYRLEPGMTFSLEPKMVFENEFSAGIESVFVVTETGHRMISKVPADIFVC